MRNRAILVVLLVVIASSIMLPQGKCSGAQASSAVPKKDKVQQPSIIEKQKQSSQQTVPIKLPEGVFSVPCIVACPTDSSVIVSVIPSQEVFAFIEYWPEDTEVRYSTPLTRLDADIPAEILIEGLKKAQRYNYAVKYKLSNAGDTSAFTLACEGSFITQRDEGSTFVFGVQGDSHPERTQQFSEQLYWQTMLNVKECEPDFYFTIGDDFSIEKLGTISRQGIESLYLYQRQYLGIIGGNSPLFIVNGNHEHNARYLLDGTANNPAVWGQNARNSYFPQPEPGKFYSGDAEIVDNIGYLKDYFSFTWGDALFVVIDYYWHSEVPVDTSLTGENKGEDPWMKTLGDEQYSWLKKTLEESSSKYKFVFTHHVMGNGRGGIELVDLYEWGGYGKSGKWEFAQKRPSWEMPVHQLMADTGVTIFFQGHDHVFVRQELDGVTYQTLPLPADPNATLYFEDKYEADVKLPGPGHVRVTVSPNSVKVDYIVTAIDSNYKSGTNNTVIYSYTLPTGIR